VHDIRCRATIILLPLSKLKLYHLILWFLAICEVKVVGKVLNIWAYMYVCAVQIINGLDIQVSSRWLHYFLATILGHHRSTPIWWLHTGLCKFVWIISTNIWHFGRHTDLKLGELYSLFIFYKIAFSWLHPPNGLCFICFYL